MSLPWFGSFMILSSSLPHVSLRPLVFFVFFCLQFSHLFIQGIILQSQGQGLPQLNSSKDPKCWNISSIPGLSSQIEVGWRVLTFDNLIYSVPVSAILYRWEVTTNEPIEPICLANCQAEENGALNTSTSYQPSSRCIISLCIWHKRKCSSPRNRLWQPLLIEAFTFHKRLLDLRDQIGDAHPGQTAGWAK